MLSVSSPSFLLPSATQFAERLKANNNAESSDDKSVKNNNKPDASAQLVEQQQLQSLKTRDREVRAHEQAHASVGGQFASSPSFTYQKGSDGVLYAVGGEVSISSSAVPGDPKATLEKAQIIQRAALAPADPSPQDRSVAASASAMAQKARVDIAQLRQIENAGTGQGSSEASSKRETSIDIFA